uniref:Intermediate capsid protein VP6 n=1 Tax=Porcine rotavirus C TaxID=10968 RepID=A0A088S676_9REOV|nr:VP6 [Porcine rotavirus C]
MDVFFSIAKTVSDLKKKVVVGTIYTNVEDIIQQTNELIRTLNGNTFHTGGIGTQPQKEWTFQLPQLGTTLLNLDDNYVQAARGIIDYLASFIEAVCDDEIVREASRNGMHPQSPALIALSSSRFRTINFNNSSQSIKNWSAQSRRENPVYDYKNPMVFEYRNSYILQRADPQFVNEIGFKCYTAGNVCQIAAFDSTLAENAQNNTQRFIYNGRLKRPISNVLMKIEAGAPNISNSTVLPDPTNQTTWLFNPVQIMNGVLTIEFYNNGQLVDMVRGMGVTTVRTFDSYRMTVDIIRPAAMTQYVQRMFPRGGPYAYQAAYMLTLSILDATTESVLCDSHSVDYSIVANVRRDSAMPAGTVFQPGFPWEQTLSNYTVAQEDNLERLLLVASVKRMVM